MTNFLALSTGGIIALSVGGFVLLMLVIWVIATVNRFRMLRENIETAFAQIDVQLKRRFDLIPNILETVKGYVKHERETLEKVIAARNAGTNPGATPDEKIEANNQLTAALAGLKVVVERYPELKADTQFTALNSELSATENKIASFRQFYNDSVAIFNRAIMKIPHSIVASLCGFKKKPYLATPEAEREAVRVKFD